MKPAWHEQHANTSSEVQRKVVLLPGHSKFLLRAIQKSGPETRLAHRHLVHKRLEEVERMQDVARIAAAVAKRPNESHHREGGMKNRI